MKAIGGFFELELNNGREYYPHLIKLNTARNCLEYILRVRNYKKIYIPYYTCDVILEPIKKLNINYEFYYINEMLEPEIKEINRDSALLYTNYFGLKVEFIKSLLKKFKNIIIDNAQAFFAEPIEDIDTFYSPRKFFGVPDGGYLSINKKINISLRKDISLNRISHLLKRIEVGAEAAYDEFKHNDKSLDNQPIKIMSELTKNILSSINYSKVKRIRNRNFNLLHDNLKDKNELMDLIEKSKPINGPMFYPFLITKDGIREYLIKNKIYVATYWPNVFKWADENSFEYKLAKYLLPLPIDQRYGKNDMKKILEIIL